MPEYKTKKMFKLLYSNIKDKGYFIEVTSKESNYMLSTYYEVEEFLNTSFDDKEDYFFGVVPRLEKKGNRRSGKDNLVPDFDVIWADVDIKDKIKEAIDSNNPNEVVNEIKNNLVDKIKRIVGATPIVVFSGGGFHFYLKLKSKFPLRDIEKFNKKLVDILFADNKATNADRLLRMPETYNSKYNPKRKCIVVDVPENEEDLFVPYKWIDSVLTGEEETNVVDLEVINGNFTNFFEALKEVYIEGRRQDISMMLSGSLKEKGVPLIDAERIIDKLTSFMNDEEKQQRIASLRSTYQKEKKTLTLKSLKDKGYCDSYTQFKILQELDIALGLKKPYEEITFYINGKEYILSPSANGIIKVIHYKDGSKREEIISEGYPTKLVFYTNVDEVEVEWTNLFDGSSTTFVGTKESVIKQLQQHILRTSKSSDIIKEIFFASKQKHIAEIKYKFVTGFDVDDDGNLVVNNLKRTADISKLRIGLEVLNEMAKFFKGDKLSKFKTALLWGLIAPLHYALKKADSFHHFKKSGDYVSGIPYLMMYGRSNTGKTTIGEIILNLWYKNIQEGLSGASTLAKLGKDISKTTLPILLNEVSKLFEKEDVRERIKEGQQYLVFREVYGKKEYAYSPLITTLNTALPSDQALLRRFEVIQFGLDEMVDSSLKREWEKSVSPKMYLLNYIGQYLAFKFDEKYIEKIWEQGWKKTAEDLLLDLYETAELEVPSWVTTELYSEDTKETIINQVETIKSILKEDVVSKLRISKDELYLKSLERAIRNVKYIKLTKRGEVLKVNILSSFLETLRRNKINDISTLKEVKNILNINEEIFTHKRKTIRLDKKPVAHYILEVSFDDFVEFLGLSENYETSIKEVSNDDEVNLL